ncbi:MAG: 50S ribosomal protein L35 [Planctomycetes bacterium]|nr:50S ribosomal protein L35 [Planctomycetota bacterium]
MPKQKTHKGLKKRVKVTATGKIKRKSAFGGHLMSSKSAKRRRKIASASGMTASATKKTRCLLGQ